MWGWCLEQQKKWFCGAQGGKDLEALGLGKAPTQPLTLPPDLT